MTDPQTPKGQDAPERFSGYDIMWEQSGHVPQPTPNGKWLRFSDHADLLTAAQARAEQAEAEVARLRGAVDAAVNIGLVLGAIGEDAVMIEAFRNECGPDLIARARAALSEGGE
jgi:hypothetical protein